MRLFVFFCLHFILNLSICAQTNYYGVVVDGSTHEPLEFVDVYNNESHTSTNENGEFHLSTKLDSIIINLLGYYPRKILCKKLHNLHDTIFLDKRFIELDEVVVTDENPVFTRMVKSIDSNFALFPYKENFFLRSVLRKNTSIIKIQDILGVVERQTLFSTSKIPMPKKNYSVEIQQMRKAGIIEGKVDFEFFNFDKLFTSFVSVYMSPKIYSFKEVPSKNSTYTKLYFHPKSTQETTTTGYYLINNNDNTFNQVSLTNESPSGEYTVKGRIKYRTIYYGLNVSYKKSETKNVYHIDKARLDAKVQVINNKAKENILYEVSYIMYTKNSFQALDFEENTSLSKDIFDINFKYDPSYWENQDPLLLTQEMKYFIHNLEPKSTNYKIKSNM